MPVWIDQGFLVLISVVCLACAFFLMKKTARGIRLFLIASLLASAGCGPIQKPRQNRYVVVFHNQSTFAQDVTVKVWATNSVWVGEEKLKVQPNDEGVFVFGALPGDLVVIDAGWGSAAWNGPDVRRLLGVPRLVSQRVYVARVPGPMSERLTRQDLKGVIRKIVAEAEDLRLLPNAYAWHRRYALGIDVSIESAQKRAADSSCSKLPRLQKSAEMALYWIRSQQADNEAEAESYMNIARSLHEGLS